MTHNLEKVPINKETAHYPKVSLTEKSTTAKKNFTSSPSPSLTKTPPKYLLNHSLSAVKTLAPSKIDTFYTPRH